MIRSGSRLGLPFSGDFRASLQPTCAHLRGTKRPSGCPDPGAFIGSNPRTSQIGAAGRQKRISLTGGRGLP